MKRKKLCCLLLVLTMLLTFVPELSALSSETELYFGNDGSFKIMIIADIQDGVSVSKYTLELIEKALDVKMPDLVILLGDNIYGKVPSMQNEDNIKKSIDTFMAPITDRNIPFALVFGNHDEEGAMSNAEQMEYYQTFDGCLAEFGNVTGVGNYDILLKKSDGSDAASLVFLDSGSYAAEGEGTYAYVEDDQIAWRQALSEELEEKNGSMIPAYIFQHIPIFEIYDILLPANKNAAGAVKGQVGRSDDGYFMLNPEYAVGYIGEGPCPPDVNNGEFQSFVERGDVVAMLFGHDHVNDFIAKLDGIDLVQTPGAGFHSYGNGYEHGVRMLTLFEDRPAEYETEMIYYKDISDAKLPLPLRYMGRYVFSMVLIGSAGILLFLTAGICILIRVRRKKRAAKKSQ